MSGSRFGSRKRANEDSPRHTKEAMATKFPSVTDILEALQKTTPPWGACPPESLGMSLPATWTRDEHEKCVRGLYPNGPYEWIASWIGTKSASEVETYRLQCWEIEAIGAAPHCGVMNQFRIRNLQ
jgi:hypothetical protein